ncbi:tyrosine-type recombinase/integrase [Candidatus Formimonas warabiya]|uniref:Site-specific integrase n=1 Tax=Formimonas warabiya TaxID=1761012 RepID=A0A3G1KNT0_FORW1|nr:site-specific integrase [Candidatus Formimonas warabiya]ATW24118.1 hypothetical protein DCMF_04385 [Candidatus Formimonas warabiya]
MSSFLSPLYSVRKYLGLKRRATYEEADGVKKEIENKLANNTFVEPNYQTVKEYFEDWLELQKIDVSPGTYDRYSIYVYTHYIPFFDDGNMKLLSIKPQNILKFKGLLLKPKKEGGKGLEPETVKGILNTLSSALDQAGLPRNPCKHKIKKKNVTNVKVPKKAVETLTEEDVRTTKAKLRKMKNVRNFVLVSEAVSTGMRSGELCGLFWPNIDLKRKTLSVTGSMKRKGSSFYWAPYGKSDRALRTIDITKKDIALFRLLKLQQTKDKLKCTLENPYNDAGYVFANGDGSPLTPMRVTHIWADLKKKLGVKVTFHGLRHTCATLWLKNGVPVHVVAQRLGHTEETITWRYGHVQSGMQRDAAEKMSQLY